MSISRGEIIVESSTEKNILLHSGEKKDIFIFKLGTKPMYNMIENMLRR
jgi:hypothetical protein